MADRAGASFCVFATFGYGFMINELIHDGRPWPFVAVFGALALWTALVSVSWIMLPTQRGTK